MAALEPSGEIEEREPGDGEDDSKEVWNAGNLRRSSECGPSAFECLNTLREYLSLPLPTQVVETQQRIEDATQSFADYRGMKLP